jgi:small conductance mechanosensitive channel
MESSWDKMINRILNWVDSAILNLPNLLLAIIVFVLAFWLSKNLERWSNKALKKVIKQASIRGLISNVLSIIIIAVGLFLALGILNLDEVLKSLLAGAGVAGLAIGLALQGTLANTFSGIFLAIKDVLNVGDWVETNGFSGKVIDIDLRNTKIKEADNNIVVIPNKLVLDNPFKNFGLTNRIRTSIECGVSYDSDLRSVKKIGVDTIEKLFPQSGIEKVEFHYLSFGASSIDFQIRFWVDATANLTSVEAKSEAIIALKEAFDSNNIDIPYPIRTLIQDNSNSD